MFFSNENSQLFISTLQIICRVIDFFNCILCYIILYDMIFKKFSSQHSPENMSNDALKKKKKNTEIQMQYNICTYLSICIFKNIKNINK